MFVPPQSSYIEILTPNVMYLEVGPWGGDKVMGVESSRMGLVPF